MGLRNHIRKQKHIEALFACTCAHHPGADTWAFEMEQMRQSNTKQTQKQSENRRRMVPSAQTIRGSTIEEYESCTKRKVENPTEVGPPVNSKNKHANKTGLPDERLQVARRPVAAKKDSKEEKGKPAPCHSHAGHTMGLFGARMTLCGMGPYLAQNSSGSFGACSAFCSLVKPLGTHDS